MKRGNSVVLWLAQASHERFEFLSKSKKMHINLKAKGKGLTLALVLSQNFSDLSKITQVMCPVARIHTVANQQLSSMWHRLKGTTHACWASQSYCQTGLLIGWQDQRRYYKPIKVIGTDCQAMSSAAKSRVQVSVVPLSPIPSLPRSLHPRE